MAKKKITINLKTVPQKTMTKEAYMKFHEDCCQKMIAITKAKNADYCGQGDDPFKNFRMTEMIGNSSVEQGFITRMLDKLARITSFSQSGMLQVKDENVLDSLLDLSNYCLLMAGYLKSKSNQEFAQK